MAGPDNFRLFFIAQIAGRAEQNLARLVKNVARNVKFRLISALKKCVLKPFISFYLSAAGVRDIAAQTVKKAKKSDLSLKVVFTGGANVL